jgi:hypothetical protein
MAAQEVTPEQLKELNQRLRNQILCEMERKRKR